MESWLISRLTLREILGKFVGFLRHSTDSSRQYGGFFGKCLLPTLTDTGEKKYSISGQIAGSRCR